MQVLDSKDIVSSASLEMTQVQKDFSVSLPACDHVVSQPVSSSHPSSLRVQFQVEIAEMFYCPPHPISSKSMSCGATAWVESLVTSDSGAGNLEVLSEDS